MKRGAEAVVEFEDGEVIKKRTEKKYRHRELDKRLRRERTEAEIKLMQEADRYGVKVPEVEKQDKFTIKMERIEGKQLKEDLDPQGGRKLGETLGYLHSADIIHGDLTTSNVIISEQEIYLIDFGLSFRSQRIEDKAVDIHLLKQVLESSHPGNAEEFWKEFVAGYSEYEESDKVLNRLEEVEGRGRYK